MPPEWVDAEDKRKRYFTLTGEKLCAEDAKQKRRVIEESLQYDMLIRISDEKELRRIVDFFKTYASLCILNDEGRHTQRDGKQDINPLAITDADEVPLLICTSRNNKKPKRLTDFVAVNLLSVAEQLGGNQVVLSTLVGKKLKVLNKILKERGLNPRVDRKYTLKVFIEDYLEV